MIPGARIVMLGRQGAGKGTQCVRLARYYVVPHISTGDMFRSAVRGDTAFGRKAKEYMDAGELVPDDVVIGIVDERLEKDDTRNRGFILDGFPRTVPQDEALLEITQPRGIHVAVNLDVALDVVLGRLASRRVCTDCGTNYSVHTPPAEDWTCDVCGGKVVQRQDDTEAAIRRRLDLYEKETAPLLSWFEERGLLAVVEGTGEPDAVSERLIRTIDEHRVHQRQS